MNKFEILNIQIPDTKIISKPSYIGTKLCTIEGCDKIAPSKGLCEMHRGRFRRTGDVTLCVNPEHLFLGTNKENSEDMVAKGRANVRRGEEKIGRAKLINAQAEEIRNLNLSLNKTEVIYNVSASVIQRIRSGKSY